MTNLTETVRKAALDAGAALVGFAPISRFEHAPPQNHPCTILPSTRTAIAIAVPQLRGTLKAVEEGTYWNAYNCDSYYFLNEIEGPRILRRIGQALEKEGYNAVPVHNPFHPHSGRQTREDQPHGPDGMVSLRIMGVAAGLGELGLSKMFLTPEFGPRQRVFAVLTDAELDATPLLEEPVCDNCQQCVKGCQANAIGTERTVTFTIDGREFSHGELDCRACSRVHRGENPEFSPFWNGSEEDGEMPSFNRFVTHRYRHMAVCVGRGCIRSCLDHLEKKGRLTATFKTPLIEQERWDVADSAPPREET